MTDHVKNQLCARIEELESEKMELNEQLDIAQQQCDALSAHVKRLRTAWRQCEDSEYFSEDEIKAEEQLYALMEEDPATSLACHDARLIKQLAMRWHEEGDAQLESGCSGIEHQGRGRKFAASLAEDEANRIQQENRGVSCE